MENNQNEKQEIIETQDGAGQKKESFWDKLKGLTTKQVVLIAAGLVALGGVGIFAAEAIENRMDRAEDQAEMAAGYVDYDDKDDDDYYANQSSSSASDSSSSSTSSSASTNTDSDASNAAAAAAIDVVDSSELDGTYTGTVADETYTLTVTGNQATLKTQETDGETETETETVVFDLDNGLAYVGDDKYTYELSGSTLTLTEVDTDLDIDEYVFTLK